ADQSRRRGLTVPPGNPWHRRRVMRPALHDCGRRAASSQRPLTRRRSMRIERLLSLMFGTALLLATSFASAQQPAAPPPPPPLYGTPISLEQAKKVMAGAEAEAKKNSWNVVIAVLDSGGNLVMLQRMDGAQFGSVE